MLQRIFPAATYIPCILFRTKIIPVTFLMNNKTEYLDTNSILENNVARFERTNYNSMGFEEYYMSYSNYTKVTLISFGSNPICIIFFIRKRVSGKIQASHAFENLERFHPCRLLYLNRWYLVATKTHLLKWTLELAWIME